MPVINRTAPLVTALVITVGLGACRYVDDNHAQASRTRSANTPPVAIAGEHQAVVLGATVLLDGSGSYDAEGDALSFNWTLRTASTLTPLPALDDTTAAVASFVANDPGVIYADLAVRDYGAASETATVSIVVLPPAHPRTADECADCHNGNNWQLLNRFDHDMALGECESCHDAVSTITLPAQHPDISDSCNACHSSRDWLLTPDLNSGKPAGHPASSDRCEACHTAGTDAAATTVAHDEVLAKCARCHNLPQTHRATSRQCNVCHLRSAWLPTYADPAPREQHLVHIDTGDACLACHDNQTWAVTSIDHRQIRGSCAVCHDNVSARGKNEQHAATTDNCGACHAVDTWAKVKPVDHGEVMPGNCMDCHKFSPP